MSGLQRVFMGFSVLLLQHIFGIICTGNVMNFYDKSKFPRAGVKASVVIKATEYFVWKTADKCFC
jgi:hypothetical protein